jgi:hypothetical protein
MESELARSQEFLLRAFDSSLLALLPNSYDCLYLLRLRTQSDHGQRPKA